MTTPHSIPVVTSGGSYEVLVGPGLLHTVGSTVRRLAPGARCFLVTDSNVAALHGHAVETSIMQAGVELFVSTRTPGEASKSWHEAGMMVELMSEAAFGRDSVVVALGGGVVGDLAGFAASIYMRGVPVIQVPTTLLGQVDSSIGGKTGVDMRHGKNLAGTFWQPLVVLADTACLSTLPESQWACGFAEVVKSAALAGDEQMRELEHSVSRLLAHDEVAVLEAVRMAAGLKAAVVGGDERESAGREQLNYGHTLGHALERELGYGTISHGAAVAEGIRFAAALSERLAGAPAAWSIRQGRLLDALGLPRVTYEVEPARLLDAMRADKKSRQGKVRFVLSDGPGQWSCHAVDHAVLLDELTSWYPMGRGPA